eukprot:14063122-Alexandrium_andersonii.AAC.1
MGARCAQPPWWTSPALRLASSAPRSAGLRMHTDVQAASGRQYAQTVARHAILGRQEFSRLVSSCLELTGS